MNFYFNRVFESNDYIELCMVLIDLHNSMALFNTKYSLPENRVQPIIQKNIKNRNE